MHLFDTFSVASAQEERSAGRTPATDDRPRPERREARSHAKTIGRLLKQQSALADFGASPSGKATCGKSSTKPHASAPRDWACLSPRYAAIAPPRTTCW